MSGVAVAFSAGEVVDQQLKEGYRHCIDDFKERYQQALMLLGRIDILRIDGGYYRCDTLKFLKNPLFCTKVGINIKCVKEELKKTQGHYWKIVDKHTKVFDCGFINIFPKKVTKKYRLILVKGQKQIEL